MFVSSVFTILYPVPKEIKYIEFLLTEHTTGGGISSEESAINDPCKTLEYENKN